MSENSKLYYVNVGPMGTFKPSGRVQTTPSDVDTIFAHIKAQGKNKLAIHFHGGLVKEQAGLQVAKKMRPLFEDAGSHPITFVWETGLLETVTRNLQTIQKTKLFGKLLKYAMRHVAKQLGGIEGRGPGVAVPLAEIEDELAKEGAFDAFDEGARGGAKHLSLDELDSMIPELEEELQEDLEADSEIEELIAEEAPQTKLLDQRPINEIEERQGRGIVTWITLAKILARVVYRIVKRFVQKREHGLYPTVVEEIMHEFYLADAGAWIWGGMKKAGEQMWLGNEGLTNNDLHAGTYFLDGLNALNAQIRGLEVDLIGHSAGSIVICHMLRSTSEQHPGLRFRNVLFLAPACTMDLFREEVVNHQNRYQRFRMFIMRDDYESKDRVVPIVYTRSLLYFISGVLEDEVDKPIAGLERFTSGEDPYNTPELLAIRKFLYPQSRNRLVLSNTSKIMPSAQEGLRSTAESHSDFDDDDETLASLKFIIGQ